MELWNLKNADIETNDLNTKKWDYASLYLETEINILLYV